MKRKKPCRRADQCVRQAFAPEGVTGFMLAISSLGYPCTLVPILVVITFGID